MELRIPVNFLIDLDFSHRSPYVHSLLSTIGNLHDRMTFCLMWTENKGQGPDPTLTYVKRRDTRAAFVNTGTISIMSITYPGKKHKSIGVKSSV
jgi:hypothetical protein